MPHQIFISYRRSDAGGHAGRLHDRLVGCYEPDTLFYDLGSIDAGADFPKALADAVTQAGVVLVLIGPDWLGELKARMARPETDHVRREVQLALQQHAQAGAPVVLPLLLGGALPPLAADLPSDLQGLATMNAMAFQGNQADWNHKFVELLQRLARVPGLPEPLMPQARARRWPVVAGVLALALAGLGWAGWQARSSLAEANAHLRIGRYDLADQRLQAVPAAARSWPGLDLARQKAALGLTLWSPRPDWEGHAQALKRLLVRAPRDADVQLLQAQADMRAGRWTEALASATLAVDSDPGNAEARFVRGSIHDASGRLPLAQADYREAAALAQASPHYQANLAHTLLESGQYADAIRAYEPIQRFALAPLEQALAHWALGQFGLAAEQQRNALQLLAQTDLMADPFNRRPWTFYGQRMVQLVPLADKRCYAQLALAASLRLVNGSSAAFPPADCPAPGCPVRQALDADLSTYLPANDPATQQVARSLHAALGDTAQCTDAPPPAAADPPTRP